MEGTVNYIDFSPDRLQGFEHRVHAVVRQSAIRLSQNVGIGPSTQEVTKSWIVSEQRH